MNARIACIFIMGLFLLSAIFPATMTASATGSRYKATSDGLNWSDDQRLTNDPKADTFPQIFTGQDNVTHIVWLRDGKFTVINLDKDGKPLGTETLITDAWIPTQYSGQYGRSLAMDSVNNLSMIRNNNGQSWGDLLYEKYGFNGTKLMPTINLTAGISRSIAANMGVGRNDVAYITYAYWAPGGIERVALGMIDNKGNVLKYGVDISEPAWYVPAHTMTMDKEGKVRTLMDVWAGAQQGIWAVTLDKFGVRPADTPPQYLYNPGAFAFPPMPVMAACPDNTVSLLRSSANSGGGNLTFIKLNDYNVPVAGISQDIVIAHGAADYGDMVCDANNVKYVVWANSTDGLIYYTVIKPGTESDAHKAIQLTTKGTGRDPKLSLDSAGLLHVTWRDDRDGNDEIYHTQMIIAPPRLDPRDVKYTVNEDDQVKIPLNALGQPIATWNVRSNAKWLSWDTSAHKINLTGTPTNAHVGDWWVHINITDDLGKSDDLNITITVVNVPPKILTSDVKTATEDGAYNVHYTSDDDGQGTVTWHLKTNATWLKVNATTGNLTGTPSNDDVGVYWVNVSVDDGNGGWASHNFTITVSDANDPPTIIMADVTTATEDAPYGVQYKATDPDKVAEVFSWKLTTNATWLRFNGTTGNLTGLPKNDDVGTYWVIITVDDGRGGQDQHKFNLTVLDTNDPPEITTTDVVTASEDSLYSVKYNFTDIDHVPQTFTWSFSTNASWLKFNATTGMLVGTPTNNDVGTYRVNITVSDGRGGVASHVFDLRVINVNDPPVFTSTANTTASAGKAYSYQAKATDVDKGDVLEYSLGTAPDGMSVDKKTGLVTWTPAKTQGGANKVVVKVTDGHVTVEQTFNIMVFMNPTITSQPTRTKIYSGESFDYTLLATDPDAGDVLTYSLDGAPAGMTIDASTGHIKWKTGDKDVGTHTFKARVTDNHGLSDEQTVTVSVAKRSAVVLGSNLLLLVLVLIIILAVLIAIVIARLRQKKKEPEEETMPEDEPAEGPEEGEEPEADGTEEEVEEF